MFADVDHAVLCGKRLVLIESKIWLPGHYETAEDGRLLRNGRPFRGGGEAGSPRASPPTATCCPASRCAAR